MTYVNQLLRTTVHTFFSHAQDRGAKVNGFAGISHLLPLLLLQLVVWSGSGSDAPSLKLGAPCKIPSSVCP